MSARFATSGIDRFAAGGWTALETGEPVIDGAVSWVRGRIVQRAPVGGSYLVSLRALQHGLVRARPCRSSTTTGRTTGSATTRPSDAPSDPRHLRVA